MTDYSKGLIYKITCKDGTIQDTYVGSTVHLSSRRRGHKSRCNNKKYKYYNLLVYKTIRANKGWTNWEITLIENFPCDSRTELKKRERHWIGELKATLNCYIPGRTDKEYRNDNKDKRQEYFKKYRNDNKEKLNEKNRDYHERNKVDIRKRQKKYREKNSAEISKRRKKYYNANKDKRLEYFKKYRNDNKEKLKEKSRDYNERNKEKRKEYYLKNIKIINEKAKEKIMCECGSVITKQHLARHKRSKKHQKFII